jgi:hypothetical protein
MDINKIEVHFPVTYFIAFMGYTLILVVERVLFDKHFKKPDSNSKHPKIKNVRMNYYHFKFKVFVYLIKI